MIQYICYGKGINWIRKEGRNCGVSVVGLFSLKMGYVTYDLATFPEERLACDLATLWKRFWWENVLGLIYAYSRTYVLVANNREYAPSLVPPFDNSYPR